jgi:hypothetical protein
VDLKPYTVSIARGDGLVARFGDTVMYIADATASADQLLGAVEAAAATDRPGAAIAERLAPLAFGAGAAHISPFGVLTPTAEGLIVILRGKVTADVDGAEGARTLSGGRALTWVDEILPASVTSVAVTGGSATSGHPHTDLRAGVVPGAGFVLQRARPKAGQPTARSEVVAARAKSPADDETLRLRPSGRPRPAETSTFSDVGAVLVSEDGAVYPLDRPYVIGRDPLGDEAVRDAKASPIAIHDDMHISRVHAYVSIDGGAVFVRDARTPGGTFIAAPGAKEWTQVGTTPATLEPGWSLRVGGRILTYHGGA